jgi:nitrogen fixation/metabolism regulation signal transduction histidine kinase
MGSDRRRGLLEQFRGQVAVRVVGFAVALTLCILLIVEKRLFLTAALAGGAALWLAVDLVRTAERAGRDLRKFLLAMRQSDFSLTFTSPPRGEPFDGLEEEFKGMMETVRRARDEAEEQRCFLETLVQHVGVGLLAFDDAGTVTLANAAARRLLGVPHLQRLTDLQEAQPAVAEALGALRAGERALVSVQRDGAPAQLVLKAAEFKVGRSRQILVSLQDIHGELEEKETEAWQNLTRVLTHEIMNSMTPISSLAATAEELLGGLGPCVEGGSGSEACAERLKDVREAMATVRGRSRDLMGFVQAYRSLALIPRPRFRIVPVRELFGRVERLMRPRFDEERVRFGWSASPESLEVTADPSLLEQVLLNLLLNALDAVRGRPGAEVRLEASMSPQGRPWLAVTDNGVGVAPEAAPKLFIPFYTTKKGGSGIGLSFSRQVMRLHGGSIAVKSEPDRGAAFTLKF